MTLLIIYVVGALSISFLCSILEATLLSSRVIELEERKSAGDKGADLLLLLKRERLDDAIGAILTLNTIAHTIGAAGAGAQAAKVYGDQWVGLFSAILTLLVLIFTEIIPKTLGTVYASALVGVVARITRFLTWLFYLPLKVLGLFTRMIGHGEGAHEVSRGELAAMVALASRQGTLPVNESRLVANVLRAQEILVEDVMTPRTVLVMQPAEATADDLLADRAARAFSRIPLFRERRDHVTGYVLQRDVLAAVADGEARSTALEAFQRQALFVPEGQAIGRLLRRLLEKREHLALVTDEYGGLSGMVTLEDLMETLLGTEIIDELDQVVDMRQEAMKLRDHRLAQMSPPGEAADPDSP